MSFHDELVKSAGVRGKTKAELADALGVGHSYVSRNVNELVAAGKLRVTNTGHGKNLGRPAAKYGRVV